MVANISDTSAFPRIVAYTAYPWENVLPRIRLLNPAEVLNVNVIKGNNYLSGIISPELVNQGDIVFIQRDFPRYREAYQAIVELAKAKSKPILYEIDDLLFDLTEFPTLEESRYYRPAAGQILKAILTADAVITSTFPLKDKLDRLNVNSNVFANYLDDRKWDFKQSYRKDPDPIGIGYLGTRSHINDIERMAPVIEYFYKKYNEKVVFQIWIERLPGRLMKFRNVNWTPVSYPNYDEYIEWFSSIQPDIWLAPLMDTPFNSVKSPVKFLEYSSKGIPGVYSRIAPYQGVVNHGNNGFLASTTEEWIEYLEQLIQSPDLRYNLGRAALGTVKDGWRLSNHAEMWRGAYQSAFSSMGKEKINPQLLQTFELLNNHYMNLVNIAQSQERKIEQVEGIQIGQEDLLLERAKEITELETGFINKQTFLKLKSLRQKVAPPASRRVRLIKQTIGFFRRTPRRQSPDIVSVNNSPQKPVYKTSHPIRLALYTTDNWCTASAHIRLIGPSNHAISGIKILNGCQASTFPQMDYFINADAVVIQRDFPRHQNLYNSIVDWAEKNHKPMIYEIDDVLYDLPNDHPEKAYFQPYEANIRNAIKLSHAVITTTKSLAKRLSSLNQNTWILPNYLDDQLWNLPDKINQSEQGSPISIGYMGGITQTHLPDIATLRQVLKRLLQEFAGEIELHFWAVIPDEFRGMAGVVFHDQRYPDYRDFAKHFSEKPMNIFVAPLIINPFNECKSAIKYLEYSSLGSPGIYSDIAPYSDVVNHGKNGLLAKSIEDWNNSLRLLIQNHQLRMELGENALKTVRQLYLLSRHASEWERVYEAAISS